MAAHVSDGHHSRNRMSGPLHPAHLGGSFPSFYSTTTAVPLAVTISMPLLAPNTS